MRCGKGAQAGIQREQCDAERSFCVENSRRVKAYTLPVIVGNEY
jgi:hypothetical protein